MELNIEYYTEQVQYLGVW